MAQVALNNNESETIHECLFYANYGKHPNLFMEPREGPAAEKAMVAASGLKTIHDAMKTRITRSQVALTKSRHKVSKTAPLLEKGDKVYLLTKNLKTKRGSKKLDYVKVGPFLIAEKRSNLNYRLELPKDARIHPVFHISLLEPADADATLQTTFHFEPQENDEFEVERILEKQGRQYLVKWKGYPEEDNTWEPKKNLKNCRKLLQQFHQKDQDQTPESPRSRHPESSTARTTKEPVAGKHPPALRRSPRAPRDIQK